MPVSKAQANQRAGRAGRESEGKSFRLFAEKSYEALEDVSGKRPTSILSNHLSASFFFFLSLFFLISLLHSSHFSTSFFSFL